MNRSRRAWLIFSAGVVIAVAGVAAISRTVVRLDREGAAARRQALVEENVRLALWRMDAAFSLFVARESLRPYFEFQPLVPEQRAWNELFRPPSSSESVSPSPLLVTLPEHVKLYFQLEPTGLVTSPEVPSQTLLRRALQAGAEATAIDSRRQELLSITPVVRHVRVPHVIDSPEAPRPPPDSEGEWAVSNSYSGQRSLSTREYATRSSLGQYLNASVPQAAPSPSSRAIEVPAGVLSPVWQEKELFLVRCVSVGGAEFIQGAWLDWPSVSRWLLGEVRDLLPNASLVTATGSQGTGERRLASLPADLIPGPVDVHDEAAGAPAVLVLIVAWLGVIIAVVASGLLLRGALELSERRGAFVSAVTHELRTPLTTFRMYTEMLADGMVTTPEQRQTYVKTLQHEAERLAHLVENVLAYSRIEQARLTRIESVELSTVLDHIVPRLIDRSTRGGMQLIVAAPPSSILVRADAAAIEQILFNLVDNACKYAGSAADKRIELSIETKSKKVCFVVRDHGPGVSPDVARRLFEPFSKSAASAATSAPGIGLGLALCLQLARSRHGDLRYAPASGGGAEFVLSLPANVILA